MPTEAGDLAEFGARDVARPSIPPEAFFVAIEPAGGTRRRLREPPVRCPARHEPPGTT